MNTSILRPGILIGVKTSLRGGVAYQRIDLEKGEASARWETTRTIDDPAEHARASEVRSKARAEIAKLCCMTAFGLLCPDDRRPELDAAIERAQAMIDTHNRIASSTKVAIYVLAGRIEPSDERAARAIASEVAALVTTMNGAIDKLDPTAIRDAANRAREMAGMLDAATQATVTGAIEQARKAARAIVKRIEKDGEAAAIVLKDIQRGALEKARMAFLELDDEGGTNAASGTLPAVDAQRFDLDLDDAPPASTDRNADAAE